MKSTIFLTLLMPCLYINAQEYKEGIIYDVRGTVKEVIHHNNKSYFHYLDEASFDTNGRKEGSITTFDSDGYPLGWAVVSDSICARNPKGSVDYDNPPKSAYNISYKVDYDDNHRVISTLMEYNVEGMQLEYANGIYTEKRFFQYQDNQSGISEVKEMKTLSKIDGNDYSSLSTYSNYVYDDHDNWIQRNVVETTYPVNDPQNIKTDEYVETRSIYYY